MARSNAEFFEQAVARYSLAMEYRKAQRFEDAMAAFDAVVELDPAYIPAYQMAGHVAVEMHDPDRARDVLNAGIEAAEKARNTHAASKMRELLDTL